MDTITTQIRFKKVLWVCPSCGKEDEEEQNASGGNTYEHVCSNCAAFFNSSGNNMKTYNGCLNIDSEEYKTLSEQEIYNRKQSLFNSWIYLMKNPPLYVEPTKKEFKDLYDQRTAEADKYLTEFAKTATLEELIAVKKATTNKMIVLEEQIVSMTPPVLEEI